MAKEIIMDIGRIDERHGFCNDKPATYYDYLGELQAKDYLKKIIVSMSNFPVVMNQARAVILT